MLADTISKVNNITFDSTSLNAYTTSLRGLSETQARVVLSSTNLDKVQKQQILNKLAETNATVSLTSAEATEALTRSLGSKEAANELLVKSGLVTKEQLLAGTTLEVSAAKLQDAVNTGLITKAEKTKILTALGLTTSNVGLATSFKLLGKQIGYATLQMLKWLVTTPVGVLTLIAGGLTVATLAIGKYNEKLEENRQEMIAAGKEASQLTEDLDGLVEEYRKLGEDGAFDNSDREQAKNIQQQINDLLGDEALKVNLVNGNYEEQLKLLRKIQHEKANDNYATIKEAKDAAEDSLHSKISNVGVGNNIAKSEMEAIEKLSKLPGMSKYLKTYEGDEKGRGKFAMFNVDVSSTDAMIASYEKMVELRNILSKSYEDEIKIGGSLEDFYNNLTDGISELSDAVTKYQDALADYNINEAVIQFNETEFDSITGALIRNEDQLKKWLNSMLASEDISDGVKQELLGLASTYFPNMSDAIAESTKQYIQNQVAASGDITKLKNLASTCGITEEAFDNLVFATDIFNNKDIEVGDKIARLRELGYELDVVNSKMNGYRVDLGNGHGQYVGDMQIETIDGKRYAVYYDNHNEVIKRELLEKTTTSGGGDKPPYTPSGGDKGSSKDDTPSYEDPTDAIINRINLRSKELEQEEESIQNAIEIAELENDYKKQISLTNDLIATRKQRVAELNKANARLHNEAEYLRNSNPWDEESWFDSQGNATESYYNLYNSSSKANQEKIKETFEKISKIKEAWVANDEELVELNKQLLQDAENLNELYDELANSKIGDIEHQIELNINNNGETFDNRTYYKQIQEIAHAEAERLRALDPEKYKEQIQEWQNVWWDAQHSIVDWRWEDSQNWIDQRNKYNDWALFDDSEVQAWERVVKWLKEEYPNELDKIQEAENNLFDARKELVDNFLSELQDKLDSDFDIRISRLNSQSSLLSNHFNLMNAIAEEQHNLNKELAEAEIAGAKMNELERQTLFTKEEHATLSAKLSKIMGDANSLQSDYLADLKTATEDTIEEITNNYERQYELKMKEYEVVKAELELAKAQQKLANVENEKSVRTWNGTGWVYEAVYQDLVDAKLAVEDAEYAVIQAQTGQAQQNAINAINGTADSLETQKNLFAKTLEELSGETKITGQQLTDALKSIAETDLPTFEKILKQFGDSLSDVFNIDVDSIRSSVSVTSSSGGKLSHLRYSSAIAQSQNINLASSIGASYDSSSGTWKDKLGNRLYANGTKSTKAGLGIFDENGIGSEYVLTKDGIIHNFNQGDMVFNPQMGKNLYELAQIDLKKFSLSDFGGLASVDNSVRNNISNDTYYTVNGCNISSEEGGELKGFINFLKRKL